MATWTSPQTQLHSISTLLASEPRAEKLTFESVAMSNQGSSPYVKAVPVIDIPLPRLPHALPHLYRPNPVMYSVVYNPLTGMRLSSQSEAYPVDVFKIPEVNPEAMSEIKAGMSEVNWFDNFPIASCLRAALPFCHAKRGPGGGVILEAADYSTGPVTGPYIDVTVVLQHPNDIKSMIDAIVFLCQNGIRCQVIDSSAKEQCIKKLSDNGRSVIIATDHAAGDFLDKIASRTPGIVIGVPMRASYVTGVPASLLGMSPKLPIMLVGANDAMGAARLALAICAFDCLDARILEEM